MGLDMYFYANKVSYKSYDKYDKAEGKIASFSYPENLKPLENYIFDINYMSVEKSERYQIGYFRKFNALHAYIIRHFAKEQDKGQEVRLNREKLVELKDVCTKVLNNRELAAIELPVQSGFFFGSMEYDDWYFKNVEQACTLLDLILKTVDFKCYFVTYVGSW